jgi:hypothetical protein
MWYSTFEMDKPNPTNMMYLAPGTGGAAHALHLPGAMEETTEFPAVDDHAVQPETGTEMFRGEVRRVMPADPAHAQGQCNIAYVIQSDVARGYVASTELLTRVDHDSDFATDACIRKAGLDPATGSRYLEEVSFEVKHTQSESDLTERARMLIRRGVRRVFAIYVREMAGGVVEAGPVKEWLAGEDRWQTLDPESEIVDRCLAHPVKVEALIDGTAADNQVARALLAHNNPVLAADRRKALTKQKQTLNATYVRQMQARDTEHTRELEARKQAHARELEAQKQAHARELETQKQTHARALEAQKQALATAHAKAAVLDLCDVLAVAVTAERRAHLDAMTAAELDALRSAIRTRHCWPEKL